ncbi:MULTISPECIES: type 1 glutamine amidotransferase [unclassified Corynebacterium]|uniref:type 1 glutamine amidotransferase n=1 Tax=unclassified Corynebacterium TaxID=2624378 RepID=UPI002651329F|nr:MULTISPECIES: glutamine amidotransferase [unclassified Corynebacterium]MDN8594192.1 glutamine amidotransferase [Corynebacterium sp. P4_F2]WKK55067.1 glutamine amidotransferase [Corynebacterium sp. P4-C1]WKK62483.1 glutamine amidotransferase [Corynebacterium sp. P8-C1]
MANALTIGLILPDVLGTYGDDGNALVLRGRARMRGIDAEILPIKLGEAVPEDLAAYTLGGGEDSAQVLAAEHLIADKGLARAAANGRPVFAVCAGLQVLGESFRAHGKQVAGLGLIDATTAPLPSRAIGEVASTPTKAGVTKELTQPLTGFENHLGGTVLGTDASPLGSVTNGQGNGGAESEKSYEGAVQGSVIATYMHGPALARNPELADLVLARAMGITLAELEPLELPEVDRLRLERMGR